jgi:DNA repair protein RadC
VNLDALLVLLGGVSRKGREHVVCVTLDSRQHIIAKHMVFKGSLNYSVVHPREIFRCAIIDRAATIVVAHNHPSGIVEPSDADIDLTQQLVAAGEILGIPVSDHIIVARGAHYSFAAHNGLVPRPETGGARGTSTDTSLYPAISQIFKPGS